MRVESEGEIAQNTKRNKISDRSTIRHEVVQASCQRSPEGRDNSTGHVPRTSLNVGIVASVIYSMK